MLKLAEQKYMHQNSSQNHSSKHLATSSSIYTSRQSKTQFGKPTVTSPKSVLVDMSNLGKLDRMLLNVQPGMLICVPQRGVVHNLFLAAGWENMVFYRGQNYFVHLIGDFYGNMVV